MTIHALPGMGANHRMYPEPWAKIPCFIAHDWVRHSGEATVEEVALSMVDQCDIRDGDDIVGASLGGIVACEIARIRKVRRLILVGSATSKEEISPLLAWLRPLANLAPIEWVRVSAGSVPLELAQMFTSVDASFVRAMCAAVFKWDGLRVPGLRPIRIHGRSDLVIRAPAEVDLLIDGGHLISITHAKQCAEFVAA